MDEFENKLCVFYNKFEQLEEKYLDEKTDPSGGEKFHQDISTISTQYLERLARSSDKGEAPPQSLQYVMLFMAKH